MNSDLNTGDEVRVLKLVAGNDDCEHCRQFNYFSGMRYCSKAMRLEYGCVKSLDENSMFWEKE